MKNETMGNIPDNMSSEITNEHGGMRCVVFAALALWLGIVLFLGHQGAFVGRAGSPPLGIFLGLVIPLTVFVAAYLRWSEFRRFILGADLRLVAAMQAWRWGGLHFLFLYASGTLPGLFAIPAGLGDMAVGITAPWIVLGLARNPSFAASRRYVIWNILGIFDFVVAVSMAVVCSGMFPGMSGIIGNITTAPMSQLPSVLTPAYVVPIFTMLHLTALLQARHLARSGKYTHALNG